MGMPELVANALALDFVNTVNKRPDPERDLLATRGDFLVWVRAALPHLDLTHADVDDTLLAAAVDLREATHAVFSCIVAGGAAPGGAMGRLLAVHAEGVANARVEVGDDAARLTWPSTAPRGVLWAVADSAVGLLTNGPLRRLGACPSCGWLFVDTSRNGTRRWCSMATCGARSKARRYYRRWSAPS
jgi:predicted RNA-binding Zn ribbon-like protein